MAWSRLKREWSQYSGKRQFVAILVIWILMAAIADAVVFCALINGPNLHP